jgi:hypothetical protein
VLPTYLTNEGGGNAFNVRFGVDFDGVRYAWKFSSEDSDNGSFQRVVRVGTRLPEDGASFIISARRRARRHRGLARQRLRRLLLTTRRHTAVTAPCRAEVHRRDQ